MYLYLDADLLNKGQSIPKQTVSTSPEVVDCPLGGSCPKGGKHTLGSQTLIEHTELAAKASQAGAPPGDESKGKDPEKPGVTPASQNMGSVGADQEKKAVSADDKRDRRNKMKQLPLVSGDLSADKEDNRLTLREFPAAAAFDSGEESPSSRKKTLIDSETNLSGHKRQDTPNPLDASNAPADSKAIDHYRLSKVAKETGDDENAKKHEKLARERSNGFSSAQHKEISEQLKAEGLNDHSDFHSKIHEKTTAANAEAMDPRTPDGPKLKEPEKKEEPKKAASSSDKKSTAKTTNKQTAVDAKKLKEENAAKVKAHSPAPATDSDHAKVLAHKAEARQLREQIQAKIDAGTMHPDDEQRAQHVLSALDVHDQLETVPSQNHQADLKTLKASSKDIAKPDKPEKEPKPQKTEKEPTPETKRGGSNGISAKQRIQTGVNAGTRLADAAVSPRGAGSAGSQVINYGGSGAVSLGHGLLTSRAEKKKAEEAEDDTDAAEVKEGK